MKGDVERPSCGVPGYVKVRGNGCMLEKILSEAQIQEMISLYLSGSSCLAVTMTLMADFGFRADANTVLALLVRRGVILRSNGYNHTQKRISRDEIEDDLINFWTGSGGCTLRDAQEYIFGLIGRIPSKTLLLDILVAHNLHTKKANAAHGQEIPERPVIAAGLHGHGSSWNPTRSGQYGTHFASSRCEDSSSMGQARDWNKELRVQAFAREVLG